MEWICKNEIVLFKHSEYSHQLVVMRVAEERLKTKWMKMDQKSKVSSED